MSLRIQIYCFIYSFCYGVLLAFLVNINHKILFESKKIFKILANLFFSLDLGLLYFIILRIINNGILHIYFLFLLLLGFFVFYKKFKYLCLKSVKSKKIE